MILEEYSYLVVKINNIFTNLKNKDYSYLLNVYHYYIRDIRELKKKIEIFYHIYQKEILIINEHLLEKLSLIQTLTYLNAEQKNTLSDYINNILKNINGNISEKITLTLKGILENILSTNIDNDLNNIDIDKFYRNCITNIYKIQSILRLNNYPNNSPILFLSPLPSELSNLDHNVKSYYIYWDRNNPYNPIKHQLLSNRVEDDITTLYNFAESSIFIINYILYDLIIQKEQYKELYIETTTQYIKLLLIKIIKMYIIDRIQSNEIFNNIFTSNLTNTSEIDSVFNLSLNEIQWDRVKDLYQISDNKVYIMYCDDNYYSLDTLHYKKSMVLVYDVIKINKIIKLVVKLIFNFNKIKNK